MTVGIDAVKSGLVFIEPRNIDVVAAGNRVSCALSAFDSSLVDSHVVSDVRVIVRSRNFLIILNLVEHHNIWGIDGPVSQFLQASISMTNTSPKSLERAKESALAHVLVSLQRTLKADLVQWLVPSVMLTQREFAQATMQAVTTASSPAECEADRWKHLPEVDATNDLLHTQLRHEEKETLNHALPAATQGERIAAQIVQRNQRQAAIDDIPEKTVPLSLSAWLLTIAVTLISLPVGVALIVFNLLRGANLRLTSQVAALSGLFFGFQTIGATSQAVDIIQGLII